MESTGLKEYAKLSDGRTTGCKNVNSDLFQLKLTQELKVLISDECCASEETTLSYTYVVVSEWNDWLYSILISMIFQEILNIILIWGSIDYKSVNNNPKYYKQLFLDIWFFMFENYKYKIKFLICVVQDYGSTSHWLVLI